MTLVRAPSCRQGLERIAKTASIAGWWSSNFESKIEVWTGDLGQEELGLAEAQWARLRGDPTANHVINAVIHNGAIVNWNADYERLRGPNVVSTVELLRAASLSPAHPKYVFISGGINTDVNGDRDAISKQLVQHGNGYSQTKFVSEMLIHHTASQLAAGQNRVSTIKPGRIIGTEEHGIANVDDFLWRVVAAAAAMRMYPMEPTDHWLHVAQVGSVAGAVIGQLLNPGKIEPFAPLAMGLPVEEFWRSVNYELEAQCVAVPLEDWKTRALENIEEVGETHPLWPVQHFLGPLGPPDNGTFGQDEQLVSAIRRNVKYLKEIGYIGAKFDGVPDVAKQDVIGRLKWT